MKTKLIQYLTIALLCFFYFEGLACGFVSLDINSYGNQSYDYAEFGIFEEKDGDYTFKKTNHIPNSAGTIYGWNIHLTTHKEIVTWKEEFILPAPASEWGDINKNEVSVDIEGKTATTKKTVVPENGWISNFWSVAQGDPSGKYVMKIYIDDTLVKTFIFFIE